MKLTCPICGQPLSRQNNSAVCPNRHSYDFARSGYLNLLRSGKKDSGDNPEMVQARTAFLHTGAYDFLRNAIKEELSDASVSVLCDLGCGEGYYTAAFPAEEKYGFDLSKSAVNYAAKHDKSTQYVISSIFHLPLPDSCMDGAVTCFAPAAGQELLRILKPGGIFVYVQPAKRHLYELKEVLYEHPYENDEEPPALPLTLIKERTVSRPFAADHTSLMNLFQMTPYAYKTGTAGTARLQEIASMSVTAAFVIRVYAKDHSSSSS